MKVFAVFLMTDSPDHPPVAMFPAADPDEARLQAERYVTTFYPNQSFEIRELDVPLPSSPAH